MIVFEAALRVLEAALMVFEAALRVLEAAVRSSYVRTATGRTEQERTSDAPSRRPPRRHTWLSEGSFLRDGI